MSKYVVDADAIHGAHLAVRSTAARLQADVASMHGQLQALQESWSGQASVAFQGIVQDWRATQARVEESLSSINEALALAGRQYADVEAGNTRLFAA